MDGLNATAEDLANAKVAYVTSVTMNNLMTRWLGHVRMAVYPGLEVLFKGHRCFFRGWKDESKTKISRMFRVKVAKRIWNVRSATLGWFSLYPLCGVIFAMCSTQLTNWWLTFRSFNLDCFIAVLVHGDSHRKFSHLPKSITGWWFQTCFSIFTWQNHPIWLFCASFSKNGLGRKNTNLGSLYFHFPPLGEFVSETNSEQKMWWNSLLVTIHWWMF